jgi:uncharacterized protein
LCTAQYHETTICVKALRTTDRITHRASTIRRAISSSIPTRAGPVNSPIPPRFGDDDLARLESLLQDPALRERALPPDAMQGAFCALATGPQPASAADAVAIAVGTDDEAHETHGPLPSAEVLDLVARYQDATTRSLADGTLSPQLYELRRGRLDYRTWCRGFLEGVEASSIEWYHAADPDELDELLFPIRVVADDLTDEERRSMAPAEWRRILLESERQLADAVIRIRDYWAIVREPPTTLRREGAKVGRNDPCPCGSGRKFKHCHGK